MIDTKNKQFAWFQLINVELLPAFTRVKVIGNLWSNCLRVNILSFVPFTDFNGNNPLLKTLWANSLSSLRLILALVLLLNLKIYYIKLTCSWLALCISINYHQKILIVLNISKS